MHIVILTSEKGHSYPDDWDGVPVRVVLLEQHLAVNPKSACEKIKRRAGRGTWACVAIDSFGFSTISLCAIAALKRPVFCVRHEEVAKGHGMLSGPEGLKIALSQAARTVPPFTITRIVRAVVRTVGIFPTPFSTQLSSRIRS